MKQTIQTFAIEQRVHKKRPKSMPVKPLAIMPKLAGVAIEFRLVLNVRTRLIRCVCWLLACSVFALSGQHLAAQGMPIENYETTLKPFLKKYCLRCHGPDDQNGTFRPDKLGTKINSINEAEQWQEALDVINISEMPPADEPQPTPAELLPILDVLYKTTEAAREVIASHKSGRMRRMNRREYGHVIKDLLDIDVDIELLPNDAGDFGFDTYGVDLTITPAQLEGYLDSGQNIAKKMIRLRGENNEKINAIFGELLELEESKDSKPKPEPEPSKPKPKKKKKGKKGKGKPKVAPVPVPQPSDKEAKAFFRRFRTAVYKGRKPSSRIAQKMESQFKKGRKAGLEFWDAIVDPMAIAIASPYFVYVVEETEQLSEVDIANRLSLLFWSSISDQELLDAAEAGGLSDDVKLKQQIARMLDDPKADRFFDAFTDQWLELNRIDLVVVDPELFADIRKKEEKLKISMRHEVRAFMKEVTRSNMPIESLVDCDFTFLDSTLADHYGIRLRGKQKGFSKVKLKGKHRVRGGILGKGAIQMLTSTGSRTSPVERGAYILRKFLDRPPAPAPANVPEVADIPAAGQSTRDLLKHHSTTPQCASCHNKMDPLGFAMESFGPMGQWRTHEKQLPGTKAAPVAVLTDSKLPDGTSFESYNDFKKILLKEKRLVARCYVKALMSYALGRPIGFAYRTEVEQILDKAEQEDFKIQSLVYFVCTSPSFKVK